jgi:surface antigen
VINIPNSSDLLAAGANTGAGFKLPSNGVQNIGGNNVNQRNAQNNTPRRKREVFAILAGIVVISAGLFAIFSIANASIRAKQTSGAIAVSHTFDLTVKANVITDETLGITTGGASGWKMSESIIPFTGKNVPVRFSQPEVPTSEYGDGQRVKLYGGNTFIPGQCTWYAFNRRSQLGRPIWGIHGDGGTWRFSAWNSGYVVNHTPEVGAVYEQMGHVGIVEEVGFDDSVRISEMNYPGAYRYSERWVTNADQFWYIH